MAAGEATVEQMADLTQMIFAEFHVLKEWLQIFWKNFDIF